MSQLQIRWASLTDVYELAAVHAAAYHEAYAGIIPQPYLDRISPQEREHYYHLLFAAGTARAALGFVDGSAAGCMILGASMDADLKPGCGEIYALYLRSGYKGIGLGSLMLSWGLKQLDAANFTRTSLWVLEANVRALRFYERSGFAADGCSRIIHRGSALVQLRYLRPASQ